jgi:hypothetical protein
LVSLARARSVYPADSQRKYGLPQISAWDYVTDCFWFLPGSGTKAEANSEIGRIVSWQIVFILAPPGLPDS